VQTVEGENEKIKRIKGKRVEEQAGSDGEVVWWGSDWNVMGK
jgi:hypothetical protein